MSDLYRKEALAHRTRALFGEVRLKAPPSTWLVTILLAIVVVKVVAALFLLDVETAAGSVRLLDWLLGAKS
ncbi:hypothetical protein [Litorimonas sp. WD9-15]|uniref:hypothetical protein n=1 Tax=Litorimonas sp. WD9-15 TaxID=3418716 RepID=UPI003CFD8E4E